MVGSAADRAARDEELLDEDVEERLVRGKRQHGQIGVQAVDDVRLVRVVFRLRALRADELHDLVLALARNVAVADEHVQIPQLFVGLERFGHVVIQKHLELRHEVRAREDVQRVERFLLLFFHIGRKLEALGDHLLLQLLFELLDFHTFLTITTQSHQHT